MQGGQHQVDADSENRHIRSLGQGIDVRIAAQPMYLLILRIDRIDRPAVAEINQVIEGDAAQALAIGRCANNGDRARIQQTPHGARGSIMRR